MKSSSTSVIKFGTDGWRAVIAQEYTFDNVRAVAAALAAHLLKNQKQRAQNGVAIGYDTRFLSTEFAQAVAQTIAAAGIPVLLSDRDSATPAIAWAVRSRNLAAGVMITASHNPPKWNGFKFFLPSGCSADKEATASVESMLGKKARVASSPAPVELFDHPLLRSLTHTNHRVMVFGKRTHHCRQFIYGLLRLYGRDLEPSRFGNLNGGST